MLTFTTPSSEAEAVTSTSATFGTELNARVQYILTANVAIWYRISASGTAAQVGVDQNHFLAAGDARLVSAFGDQRTITVIKDTGASDGYATLSTFVGSM